MSRVSTRLLVIIAVLLGVACSVRTAAAQGEIPYRKLRYEEDYSTMAAPGSSSDVFDQLKFIPLTTDKQTYLSFGGGARERYTYTANPAFGEDPPDKNGAFLQRYLLNVDLHLNRNFRIFTEFYSALANGQAAGPTPTDEDQLTLQNAFLDIAFDPDSQSNVTLRTGIQELDYGSGRLVSMREGPNVRRAFYAGRGILELPDWRIDALVSRPRSDEPGVFDDTTNQSQALWGLYAVGGSNWLPAGQADLYYLGYNNDDGSFEQGSARERRHSLGGRLWGSKGDWDWNWESLVQVGRFGEGNILAWTVATDTGHTWSEAPWSPRLGINSNVASGDKNPNDKNLQTFNPMYPRGSYFSEAALLGPQNFFDFHPFLTVNPSPSWSFTAAVDFFWRLETGDGVYAPNGSLIRPSSGSTARYVATEFDLTAVWLINRHFSFTAVYSHILPGQFIKETGSSKTTDFVELTVGFRF